MKVLGLACHHALRTVPSLHNLGPQFLYFLKKGWTRWSKVHSGAGQSEARVEQSQNGTLLLSERSVCILTASFGGQVFGLPRGPFFAVVGFRHCYRGHGGEVAVYDPAPIYSPSMTANHGVVKPLHPLCPLLLTSATSPPPTLSLAEEADGDLGWVWAPVGMHNRRDLRMVAVFSSL